MPERACKGCTTQADWGCQAYKFKEPEPEEDERDCWVNPATVPVTVDGEDTYACPRQTLYRSPSYWNTVLKFYGMYKQGFLPQVGATMDQSNKAIEIFRILDVINQECDAVIHANANRKRGDPSGNTR